MTSFSFSSVSICRATWRESDTNRSESMVWNAVSISSDIADCSTDEVDLAQQGSGDTAVYARKRLHADLTGSGEARVFGNPDERSVSRNGSATVSFDDKQD